MKRKILIILIILIALSTGGFFIWRTLPREKPLSVYPKLLPDVILPDGYDLSAPYIAPLAAPGDIEITPQGDLLITENGLARIKKVTLSGEVSTYVNLPQDATALVYNGKGELFAGGGAGIFKISPDGKIFLFSQTSVSKIVLGPDGAFYTVDWHTASPDIKKITPKGEVTTFATGLSRAFDIAFSPSGELYVADPGSQRIVKVNTDGTMTTLVRGLWTDPASIVFDKQGNLFVAGGWIGRADILVDMGLYKVSLADGSITPVVLAPDIAIPLEGMAIDDFGNIYGAVVNHGILYKISPEGEVKILVDGWHDGFGLAVGPGGDLFVADRARFPSKPGRIFKLDMAGNVTLFADGLRDPVGLTFDAQGNLFVVEMSGYVLKITPEGQKITLYQTPKGLRSITFDPVSGDFFVFVTVPDIHDEILRITPAGVASVLPVEFDKDIFTATLAADGQGNILAHVIYRENFGVGPTISDLFKITLDGKKTLLAHFVDEVPAWEGSIAVNSSGDSYLLAHSLQAFKIRKITPEGNVSVFADNLPIDPFAIAMNKEGDIFFTSALGIFKISPE